MKLNRMLLSGAIGFFIAVEGQVNQVAWPRTFALSALAGLILGAAYALIDKLGEKPNDDPRL